MSRRPRRNHSPAFKAKVAEETLRDGKTVAEIAQKHDVHPNQVTAWGRQLLEPAVSPQLLRGPAIERANQVWALDITYVQMARGWVYPVVVLDWHSRWALAHRVSITMAAG